MSKESSMSKGGMRGSSEDRRHRSRTGGGHNEGRNTGGGPREEEDYWAWRLQSQGAAHLRDRTHKEGSSRSADRKGHHLASSAGPS
eukprot:625182-Prorocentrum_minimum.AAC.1